MTDTTILPITSPDEMRAILQYRCSQLMAGIQHGAHPQQIKDHIVSMYQAADILVEKWESLQADAAEPEQAEGNGEDRAH